MPLKKKRYELWQLQFIGENQIPELIEADDADYNRQNYKPTKKFIIKNEEQHYNMKKMFVIKSVDREFR